MNITFTGALAGVAALFAASSALASPMPSQSGHYEWRTTTQAPGPRAPIAVSRRVWVADPTMSDATTTAPKMAGAHTACPMPCGDQKAS